MIRERMDFANRQDLAAGLAGKVSRVLSQAISRNGSAILAVSGGSTPALFFEHLSLEDISWNKVTVTLVDERHVPDDHPRSNARLVKAGLLQNQASAAIFLPLFPEPAVAPRKAFDCTVLGLGNDGHTASFFPGGDTLSEVLAMDGSADIVAISAAGSGEPRLTYTLPRLVASGYLALHIEGAGKLAVLEQALSGSDIYEMPIRAVLSGRKPIDVYWCP